MSADEMREHVKALHEKITSEQQSLESLRSQPGLKVLLGNALRKPSLPLPWSDLMRGKGSMSVNKMQWRQEMRRLVEQPLTKEVDDLFAELDIDKAGILDMAKLGGLRSLPAIAQEHEVLVQRETERVASLVQRAEEDDAAMEAAQAAEAAQARLDESREKRSVRARVGALLAARNVKVSDLVNGWQSTQGEMSRGQFRRNLKSLGLDDESLLESDALFDSLDSDGGGTLDIDELKEALTTLQEATKAEERELVRLRKSMVELWKEARAAQAKMVQRRQEEVAAEREREEVKAAQRRAEEEAREAARAMSARLAAEAMKRKAEQQAAFEAKIAAKRMLTPVTAGIADSMPTQRGLWSAASPAPPMVW